MITLIIYRFLQWLFPPYRVPMRRVLEYDRRSWNDGAVITKTGEVVRKDSV